MSHSRYIWKIDDERFDESYQFTSSCMSESELFKYLLSDSDYGYIRYCLSFEKSKKTYNTVYKNNGTKSKILLIADKYIPRTYESKISYIDSFNLLETNYLK